MRMRQKENASGSLGHMQTFARQNDQITQVEKDTVIGYEDNNQIIAQGYDLDDIVKDDNVRKESENTPFSRQKTQDFPKRMIRGRSNSNNFELVQQVP